MKNINKNLYYTARATLECISLIKKAIKKVERRVIKIENLQANRRKGNG
jgi:hypothetical protein